MSDLYRYFRKTGFANKTAPSIKESRYITRAFPTRLDPVLQISPVADRFGNQRPFGVDGGGQFYMKKCLDHPRMGACSWGCRWSLW
jgi:hypothetical protein